MTESGVGLLSASSSSSWFAAALPAVLLLVCLSSDRLRPSPDGRRDRESFREAGPEAHEVWSSGLLRCRSGTAGARELGSWRGTELAAVVGREVRVASEIDGTERDGAEEVGAGVRESGGGGGRTERWRGCGLDCGYMD